MLIHWGTRLLICVEDVLRHQRRSTVIEALDIGNFLFADPNRLAGRGVFGDQVRCTLFNVEHADLRSLGVGIERVRRDLGSDVVLVGFSPVHPMQANSSSRSLRAQSELALAEEKNHLFSNTAELFQHRIITYRV